MLIFLYGQDTYRSKQKLNEIIDNYKKIHKSGLNLRYYDFKTDNFQDFQDSFQQSSMFKEKKLAVFTNAFSNEEFKEKFLKNSKKFQESPNLTLFYEEEISEKDPLFKFLSKNAQVQEFNPLDGQRLRNWVKKEFAKYNCKISEENIEKLIEFIGNDLWRFSNEIRKLTSFKSEIKEEDIEILIKPKIETDIFRTIDFIAAKNKKRALELLKKHLEKGDHPLYLLSMINYQFRNLLIVKDLIEKNVPYYLIIKKTQVHPFVVRKSFELANKFTLSELKKIYQKIFEADLDIKTGQIGAETALDLLIADI